LTIIKKVIEVFFWCICAVLRVRYNASPVTQVHLLLGPNAYALAQERLRWTQMFREKHGSENLAVFDGNKVTFRELRDEVTVAPFIAAKRLIVVEGVPKGKRGEVSSIVDEMHPDVALLFTLEAEIGKNAKFTVAQKELKELASCTEFPLLSSRQLRQWIEEFLATLGGTASPAALQLLLDMIGEDQQLLAQELRKISLYAHGRRVEAEDVRTMVACSAEREVWKLMDYLGDGRIGEALRYVHELLDRGFSPQALWNTFLWMLALLVEVVACVEDGETNPWTIARDLHVHGAGVRAILPSARKMDRTFLERILRNALAADRGLKTGMFKATNEAPEELLALIDRSILSFA